MLISFLKIRDSPVNFKVSTFYFYFPHVGACTDLYIFNRIKSLKNVIVAQRYLFCDIFADEQWLKQSCSYVFLIRNIWKMKSKLQRHIQSLFDNNTILHQNHTFYWILVFKICTKHFDFFFKCTLKRILSHFD